MVAVVELVVAFTIGDDVVGIPGAVGLPDIRKLAGDGLLLLSLEHAIVAFPQAGVGDDLMVAWCANQFGRVFGTAKIAGVELLAGAESRQPGAQGSGLGDPLRCEWGVRLALIDATSIELGFAVAHEEERRRHNIRRCL